MEQGPGSDLPSQLDNIPKTSLIWNGSDEEDDTTHLAPLQSSRHTSGRTFDFTYDLHVQAPMTADLQWNRLEPVTLLALAETLTTRPLRLPY
ncbi:hypothetical protein AVEN_268267-1 [Araneus ventricosus]|uniref:Uncharacterized protein n=1 Tax=Araneus ventricosus TaxID=182803 RepID=A0A4Y2C1H2_ARAVE|nr:hypothetical protein AVEN_268267-1 [Araneus ventricosus]